MMIFPESPLRSWGDHRDIEENVFMIRQLPESLIEFHCFNRYEVDETVKLLTPAERNRVRFFWLTWPREANGNSAGESTKKDTQ